jgi:MFS family permease
MGEYGLHTNRNFLLLWSGNATSLVGFHGVRIAYPMLALAVTGSPAAAGWIGFALSVPSLIFQFPAGIIADSANRIQTLILCQIIGLSATALAAIAVAAQLPCLWPILIATAFIEGSVYVFVGLSELGAIRDVVSPAQRRTAFSFFEAEQAIATLAGRAAGAATYGVSRSLPFLANAASYLYCLIALSLIRSDMPEPSIPVESAVRPGRRNIVDGMRVIWTEPFLRSSTMMSGLSNVVIQVVLLLILLELQNNGHPAWTIGLVLGAAGVGGIIGAAAASRLIAHIPPQLVYRGALWAWTALLVPISFTAAPWVLAACWCGIGGIGVLSNVALTIYQIDVIPEDILGRALATVTLVSLGAVAVGALGAGYLLSLLGTVPTRWISLAAMGILALYASTRTTTTRVDEHGRASARSRLSRRRYAIRNRDR